MKQGQQRSQRNTYELHFSELKAQKFLTSVEMIQFNNSIHRFTAMNSGI